MTTATTDASLHASTRRYVSDESVACLYDSHFADLELFDFDSSVLAKWFARPGRLIDLGCGTGRHLVQFARRGFETFGVDLSGHMIRQARVKLKREKLRAQLLEADFCNLPVGAEGQVGVLGENTFDYALCMFSTLGMIYGRHNRLRFLRSVHQLLKPGGRFALHVHNRGYNIWRHEGRVFLLNNFIRSRLGLEEVGDKFLSFYRGIRGMYIHVFTEVEITGLLGEAGFEIVELLPLNRTRTAELKGRFLRSLRSNGFLILAQAECSMGNKLPILQLPDERKSYFGGLRFFAALRDDGKKEIAASAAWRPPRNDRGWIPAFAGMTKYIFCNRY